MSPDPSPSSSTPAVSPAASPAAGGGRRWRRRLLSFTAGVIALILACGGWVVYQHTYDLREEQVTITGGEHPLKGVLALPPTGRGPFGLVVFVHGDGPIDATHETFYRPAWEALAEAGYASLSWNKPGVGGAPGQWLHQSMDDRARETLDAIAWAKTRPDVDPARIGLWGASQAGWVMPKVAVRMPELRFVIAVSPAVNWLRQGRYNLLAELEEAGASPREVRAAVARSDRTRELLAAGASFERYRAALGGAQGMTPDRWRFVLANHTSDATADLERMRTPVLLMLGGHDVNVDVAETEDVYRRLLRRPGQLQVRHYPDATHSLVPKDVEGSELRSFLLAVAAPRSLAAEGYLDDLRRYAVRQDGGR
ncbi:S9 family peptidase [Planomonospora sp. ID82291]|uniref:alpha/beta hydrolase family protein n=1 Tax=Planomonospora sp. ID82291 TaxID=2738136 RepID=UPI001A2A377F|nr:alpha/beta hydrolase [Planomonospora sp. ID82291]MBG0815541.1 alpha/beta hydrolase [Planomonospora sp. ID82291]